MKIKYLALRYYFFFLLPIGLLTTCKKNDPDPKLGLWVAEIVKISGQEEVNFAGSGRLYANFQLNIQTVDSENTGTYTVSGVPTPYNSANISGTWEKTSNVLNLTGIPNTNGFATLIDLNVDGEQMTFTVNLTNVKTGSLVLKFILKKQNV